MHPVLRNAVSLFLLGTAATVAQAQDAAAPCKAYVDNQWQALGEGPLTACLKAVDRWVPGFNAQGFKFGLWGTSLLSVDNFYFYSSADQGSTWAPLGLKADLIAADRSPELPGLGAAPVIAAIAADAAAATAPVEPVQVEEAAATHQAPVIVITEPVRQPVAAANELPATEAAASASAPVIVSEPTVISATAPTSQPLEQRRACSMQVNGRWETTATHTVEQCAAKLAATPDRYDENGFKYAYWSGIFLAADKKAVYKSENSGNWDTVLAR